MKRIRVTRHIAAPPEAVFDVILDVDRYPEWNPFTPRTTARTDEMAVGKEFDLDCWMTDTQLLEGEREVVLALDRERYHFCMGTSRTRGRPGIKSFRWQKCEPSPGGGTDFENYESFHGPLGPLV
ncbi:MAG: SRPBCC family protein, partial [Myxococcales bacterium]|nr:SRPBCC family protein [Myxococcales bacterium]